MPLEKLGKYERLDVLGHGASGIVYLAKDTLLGKQVALKEISAQGEEKERFLEEARVLDRLRHPNIVQVNSVDEIGGRVVIDMEYVRGRNLQEILRETPQLPINQAVSIASQICDGLAYAHSQRTVHRDIKPANILLTRDGVVKLVDFGLAEVLGTHSFAGGAGTYAYMAPEDFHPEEHSDRQSDIWAVGVILYEMLAGRRPFHALKAKDPFAWKTAIESNPIPLLSELRFDIPPSLSAICARALTRDKLDRYHSAGEMAADLRALSLPAGLAPAQAPVPESAFLENIYDLDSLLLQAPDHWEAVRDALTGGTLSRWLHRMGEEPLAAVAEEAASEAGRDDDEKLRDFLYRAGVETAEEARRSYEIARQLTENGLHAEARIALRRAAFLDPQWSDLDPQWADTAHDPFASLSPSASPSGADSTWQTKTTPPQIGFTLSREAVDFGVLRWGQSRICKISLRNTSGSVLEGRISAVPGWLRAEPSMFSTRRKQTILLSTATEAIWTGSAVYQDMIVLETSAGRREISVSVRILPTRLSWSRIAFWYLPLLVCAALPVAASLGARTAHPPVHFVQQPGFAAGGLLFLSAFVLTLAADTAWPPRLLPLGLSALVFWRLSLMSQYAGGSRGHLLLVQAVTPILVLLILQVCALILDASRWGNWKIWRWIVAAVGILISYSLLHSG